MKSRAARKVEPAPGADTPSRRPAGKHAGRLAVRDALPRSPHVANAIDLSMMRHAMALADRAAAAGEVPIGAVIYRGSTIVAEAWNLREAGCDPTGHAEMLALRHAGAALGSWRLNDCSMAVTLEPCPMCAGALVNARLGRLVYGCADPKAGACETLYAIPVDARLNHRVKMIGGVLADECRSQLQGFFQQRRRRKPAG